MDSKARRLAGIIALIDQLDNSITICVIQMVFNFPQRYLYFPIYISFVRNCLAPPPSVSSPGDSFFVGSFKNCGLSHLHIVNLSTVRSLKFDCRG